MKRSILGFLLLVSFSAFSQIEVGDVIQGESFSRRNPITSYAFEFKKIKWQLEAEVLEVNEDNIKLGNIIGDYPSHDLDGLVSLRVAKKSKKYICESFGFGELMEFSTKREAGHISIRSSDGFVTTKTLSSDGKEAVFDVISCSL